MTASASATSYWQTTTIEFLDRPPTGWFVLDVMRREPRKRDWVALMIDVDPDDFVNRRAGMHATRNCWVRIPGKHATRDAAWDAFEELAATRH
jgi:hypothetical protein